MTNHEFLCLAIENLSYLFDQEALEYLIYTPERELFQKQYQTVMNIGQFSLNALHAFECAARHQSFTEAGKELHVTQGAISQQIKQLESQLGFLLFHRQPRKLILTTKGKRLAEIVRNSLFAIQNEIEELQSLEYGKEILKISVMPSFGSKWLMARIGKFNQLHPNIKLEISSEGRKVDLHVEDVDLGIRYGDGNYPGLDTTLLMKEEVFPVCSPAFLEKNDLPRTLEDLNDYDLIHDTAGPYERFTGLWETWLEIVGVKGIDLSRGTTYNLSELVMNAAVLGHGIALGRSVLVADDIAAGRLVRLFDISVEAESSYFVVSTKEGKGKEKIRLFRQWLLEEAQAHINI